MCLGSRMLFNAPFVQHDLVWPLPLQNWLPLCSSCDSALPIGSHAHTDCPINSPCTQNSGLFADQLVYILWVSPAYSDMQLSSLVLVLQHFMGHLQSAEQHTKAMR